jgi:hypothetical protein
MLLWVPSHCGIQGNKDGDVLAREALSIPFYGPKPVVSISPYVGRLRIKEWLKERHSEHWATTSGVR